MEDCFMSVPPSNGMNSRQSCKVAFAAWSVVGDWREPERRRSSASASLVQRKVRRRHVVTTALDKNGQSVQCMLSRTRNQCKPRSLSLYLWFFFADKKKPTTGDHFHPRNRSKRSRRSFAILYKTFWNDRNARPVSVWQRYILVT